MGRHLTARAVIAAALVLSCAGCIAGPPAPAPSPAGPDASQTPPPEPAPAADPLSTVSTMVVRPEALQLSDETGAVVAELGYLSDASTAVDTLTVVFGSEPTDEEFRGSSHDAPSTAHRWGAFELWEAHYDDWVDVESAGASLYLPAFRVRFTGPEALGIQLTDVGGRHVGGSWAELTSDPGIQTNPTGCSGPYVDFISQPEVWPDGTEHVQKVSVDFQPDEAATSIARIGAPMSVHEDGCA